MSLPQFPHLLPAERFLWARFLVRYGRQWDAFDYDVRLGEGRPVDPDLPPYIQEMARRLSKKRLDAVGFQGGLPTLFEVTPRGSRTTVGALELYDFLWRRQYPDTPAPRRAAVVERIDPDILRYFEAAGDLVFVVPDGASGA